MSNSGAISFTNLLSPEPSTSNLLLVFLLLSIALPFQSLIISFFKSQIWPSLGFKRSRQCYSKWFYLPDTQPWPLPEPVSDDFQLSKSIEPKFRPFKWGPTYTINMGIRPLNQALWLPLHSSYPSYIKLREARHSTYGSKSCQILPSNPTQSAPSDYSKNRLAALEAARTISAFLANRFPKLFKVFPEGSEKVDDGWGIKKVVRLEILEGRLEEKSWNLLDEDELIEKEKNGEAIDCPMMCAGELVPDDLALLLPDPQSSTQEGVSPEYRLIAGSICTAGFWRLEDKIGTTLREIHRNGDVPQYEEKLEAPMNRFFSKIHPNKPVERNNYFFQIFSATNPLDSVAKLLDGTLIPDILSHSDPASSPISGLSSQIETSNSISSQISGKEVSDLTELSWSHSTNGPESLFDQKLKGPQQSDLGSETQVHPFESAKPAIDPSEVVMRTERQTLRRLPRSGAVLFTIRTYLVPVPQIASEPGCPGRLASAIRSWSSDVKTYKGGELYEGVLLPYLDEEHKKQVGSGICGEEDEERGRSKGAYPF